MFGYVRIAKPELKMGDFERYQGVYCSLCRVLGKKYGFVARMSLSYDFTFLALLGMATDDRCVGFAAGRCPYNPLKKRLCCGNTAYVEYAADAAMLLLYYKLDDSIRDDGFWKRTGARILRFAVRRSYRRAAAQRPDWDAHIAACMQQQMQVEEQRLASVDAAAEPTALMLSRLAEDLSADETQRQVFARFGYCLGRYVYLIDAMDDLSEDIRHKSYNPYAVARGLYGADETAVTEAKEYAARTLYTTLAVCKEAYEEIDIKRFDEILRNVLEHGMFAAVEQVLQSEKRGKRDARSV